MGIGTCDVLYGYLWRCVQNRKNVRVIRKRDGSIYYRRAKIRRKLRPGVFIQESKAGMAGRLDMCMSSCCSNCDRGVTSACTPGIVLLRLLVRDFVLDVCLWRERIVVLLVMKGGKMRRHGGRVHNRTIAGRSPV